LLVAVVVVLTRLAVEVREVIGHLLEHREVAHLLKIR
jgi:hypothetical protein